MVQLIGVAQEALSLQQDNSESKVTPKWITPMLLFIDLYEKVVLAMKRRDAMSEVCSSTWKWFEVASGKWQEDQAGNNKTINDAFWAGEQTVKFTNGRKKYSIQFGAMMQANEESGSKKPIMIVLKRDEKATKKEDKDSLNVVKRGRWTKEDVSQAGIEKESEGAGVTTPEEEEMETTAITMASKGILFR